MSARASAIEVYLIRHAVAAERGPDWPDDGLRPLTADGAARFREAVRGLRTLEVTLDLVLHSPLARTRETAEILRAGLRPKPPLVPCDALAPGGDAMAAVDVVADAVNRYGASRLALVGHAPDIGLLAARWLGAAGIVAFKKGAVCRIDLDRMAPESAGVLRWFLPPRVLRGLER